MNEQKWIWYHSTASRNECETVLFNQKDGTFLVRPSESSNDLVLSLCWSNQVHHYKIKRNEKGLYLEAADGIEQCFFNTLDKLISWYKVPERGLKYLLKQPYLEDSDRTENVASESDEEEDEPEGEDKFNDITFFFKQQLETLYNVLRSDKDLSTMLVNYVEKGAVRDFQKANLGSTKPLLLQQLLVNAGSILKSALEVYLKRLNIIKQLFDVGSNTKEDESFITQDCNSYPEDLESILRMMSECKNAVLSLEKKACKVFQEYSLTVPVSKANDDKSEIKCSLVKQDTKLAAPKKLSKDNLTRHFEVASGALKTKSYILLDIQADQIYFAKSPDDLETSLKYCSDQVVQLVKSKNSRNKLNILLENLSSKSYYFENYKARELFCQIVQQMKIAHSKDTRSTKLSIFIGTWNMGGANVQDTFSNWFKCIGEGKTRPLELSHIPADIYAIGTQESAYHEKEWIRKLLEELKKTYNKEFKTVTCTSLWGIRLAIFIKPEYANLVSSIRQSSVKTGIANALGNKGAVGVSLHIGSTSFCFINCHLASGFEKLNRRNQDFNSILRSLNLGQGDTFDLTLSFHHLFWFGDLNYRISLDITDVIKSVMERDWRNLISNDQLLHEMEKENVFYTFEEDELSFPPTYRYKPGARSEYVWIKEKRTGNRTNIPSWCDRVLWKSYPELTSCNTAYGCPVDICTSDHSPVFATFDVDVLSQTLSPTNTEGVNGIKTKLVRIKLFNVQGKIKTSSSTNFVIEFHSNCFEKPYLSKKNSLLNQEKKFESLFRKATIPMVDDNKNSYPWWAMSDLPELIPVISDMNYLKDQHLLIAVKGDYGNESYGECLFSLKQFLSGEIQEFESSLTHLGDSTGMLKIKLQMMLPKNYVFVPPLKKNKIYDLISIENDDCSPATDVTKTAKGNILTKLTPIVNPSDKEASPLPPNKMNKNLTYSHPPPNLPPKKKLINTMSTVHGVFYTSKTRGSLEEFFLHDKKSTSTENVSERPPVPLPRLKKAAKMESDLMNWLAEIDLHSYFDNFNQHGFDDPAYFSTLTEHDLIDIGIDVPKHRIQILKHAANTNHLSPEGMVQV